jgi:hypothetical protein
MDNLPIDIKYKVAEYIFKPNTIKYLIENNYEFKPNLHSHTLKCLHDKNFDIFENLILNGSYDDNYYWVYSEENKIYRKQEHIKTNYIYKNLLFLMIEHGYKDFKFYKNIGLSKKKDLNLINSKTGETVVYLLITGGYDEKFIIELIGTNKINCIHAYGKKTNKLFDVIWYKKNDSLLELFLKNIGDSKNKFSTYLTNNIYKTNNYQYLLNSFPKSLKLLYQIIPIDKNKVGESSRFFYLSITKIHYPNDYVQVIKSKFIYNHVLNIIRMIALKYLANTNTDIAIEILEKTDVTKISPGFFGEFYNDVLEIGLIKAYEDICNGNFSDDTIPTIINTIIYANNLNIKYKDIDDFVDKIKLIISKLVELSLDFNEIHYDILLRSIEQNNVELSVLVLNKYNFDKFKFNKFFIFTTKPKPDYLDKYNGLERNHDIIHDCLKNNLNKTIVHMIKLSLIDLIGINYYSSNYILDNTFLELIVKEKKYELIQMILSDESIHKIHSKSNLVNSTLFLSCVFNCPELVYLLFENFSHCIDYSIFSNDQIYRNRQCALIYLVKNKFDEILNYLMIDYQKLNFMVLDNLSGDSLITLMIKNDYVQYIEKVINTIGKDIFKHIPMHVLNKLNLEHAYELSNGTELFWACKKNLNTIAWFFISNKLGRLDEVDYDCNNCLIYACINSMETVAGTLIQLNRIDLKTINLLGKTALDYAKQNKMEKVCELIRDNLKKYHKSKCDIPKFNCEKSS